VTFLYTKKSLSQDEDMFIIYDLIFLLIMLVYLPGYWLKGKFHAGFFSRFGNPPQGIALDQPIWIHAVSVGEVVSIKGLLDGLRRKYPRKKFVITTVTPSGNKIARQLAGAGDLVTYLPFDFSFMVSCFVKQIDPCILVLAETEIWPNLIRCLNKRGIPMVVVNARISDRSLKGYLILKFLVKPILNKINLFCCQADADVARLARLGVDPQKIQLTGNMKFDACPAGEPADQDYRKKISLNPADKLLVCGSTHPGEEEIILRVFKKLQNNFPGFRLLLAPRHPERSGQVAELVRSAGFLPLRISQIYSGIQHPTPNTVFILDTIGQLMHYYAIAQIVFVGGSLVKKGGHNILEPAALAKPVIFGPQMYNFRDIAGLFIAHRAAIMVNDGKKLESELRNILDDQARAEELGRKARELIGKNTGATLKNIALISRLCPC